MCPPDIDTLHVAREFADHWDSMSFGLPPTILIVDDDPVVRSLMRDTLEDQGYQVEEASDGVEACQVCNAVVPSLLIVDAMMPNMDGFELCQELRRQPATRHAPILMAIGPEDHSSIADAFDAGATDFIGKPLNWPILTHRIRYMLRGARTIDDLRQHQQRLHEAQEQEREQRERFAAALSNMSQGLCMFGADGGLIVANSRFHEMLQLPQAGSRPGQSMADMLRNSPLFASGAGTAMDSLIAGHVALTSLRDSATLTQEFADGRVFSITHEPMPNGGFVDTYTDVTQQRVAESRIAHMALHDPLTDLPNRLLFRQRLEFALHRVSRGEPCAVLFLDLDRFKDVNDTLGHPAGDGLLKEVTGRLRRILRQTDTVARLGGDEFAIIQSSVNHPEDATILAGRLLRELSEPYRIGGHQVIVSTSIGIAIAPEDGFDPDLLLKNADIALYQAKNDGRNRYRYFKPEMNAQMQARRELEIDLRNAVAANEFTLYFQPLVNLKAQKICGFEALLRWPHPVRGMVSPADFIPLAEEIGLIDEIGEWVLRTACRHAKTWPEPLKVSVNVSTVQFRRNNLIQAVTRALWESGLDAARLDVEITESVMVHDFDAALSVLHELKQIGVSITMDDFGTGYSSLGYLRSFPFDKIKIDQSFVKGLGTKSDCIAIIRAVTGLCDSLGIIATAEGVETAEQLTMLEAESCTEIQGYLIARPCPSQDVAALLENFSRVQRKDLFHDVAPVELTDLSNTRER